MTDIFGLCGVLLTTLGLAGAAIIGDASALGAAIALPVGWAVGRFMCTRAER